MGGIRNRIVKTESWREYKMSMKALLKLCLLASIGFFSVTCSNSVKLTGNEFLIQGKISDLDDGIVITLSRIYDGEGRRIATDTVRNGRFMFRENLESNQEQFSIFALGDGFSFGWQDIWAAPRAKIKISGTGKLPPLWKVKSSVPYQKEQNRYKNKSSDIIAELAPIVAERSYMFAKLRAAASEDEIAAYKKIYDSLDVISDELRVKKLYNDIFIMEKADITPIWISSMSAISFVVKNANGFYDFLDTEQAEYFREKALELYSRMSEEDRNSYWGNYITANLIPPRVAKVGEYMVDTYLSDVNGNIKNLVDYLGKYLLLDFWNRACAPCIAALPEMSEIAETYRDKLTIISISLDTEIVWKEATATHNMPWINLRDPKNFGGLAASYGVTAIPNYVLISSEGIIIDKWAGYGAGFLKQKVSENIE